MDQQHCTSECSLSGGIRPVLAEPEMQTQLPATLRARPDLPADEPHVGMRSIIMGRWHAGICVLKKSIPFEIPPLLDPWLTVLLPGILIILTVAIWSSRDTTMQPKHRDMQLHDVSDAGDLMTWANLWVLPLAQFMIGSFTMRSHALAFSIMRSILAEKHQCMFLYTSLAMLALFIITLPRDLERLSRLSSIGFLGVFATVMACMIVINFQGVPHSHVSIFIFTRSLALHDACLLATNAVRLCAAYVAFCALGFTIRDLRDLPKAWAILHVHEMILYAVTAIVIDAFVGPEVPTAAATNPADNFSHQISLRIALPTVVIGCVIHLHIAVEFLQVHIFRGNGPVHILSFMVHTAGATISICRWVVSWTFTHGGPIYHDVLGLVAAVSSLFISWIFLGLPGPLRLYIDRYCWPLGPRQRMLFCIDLGLSCLGLIICVIGLYASAHSIWKNVNEGLKWMLSRELEQKREVSH